MSTITASCWRSVDEDDKKLQPGFLSEELCEEFPHFLAFIRQYVEMKACVQIGVIYRSWLEFRDYDFSGFRTSSNDMKRLWTAVAVHYADDPIMQYIPEPCILWDIPTEELLEQTEKYVR